ncbi:hypothetical protein GCM10011273_26680 [Asticcacaulis endophyticus]|uniref:Methyl-accepting chemotaxis protein n=1 Tax=Asticcacaulis endophyticus TaxID=1395890 RepID=A0A918QBN9_9CAUL|nr:hypothetical protein GCM10011273_26680 [Asticcacaulis endophyticus]
MDELSNLTTAMVGAVEEQAATTQKMSSNITGVSTAAAAPGERWQRKCNRLDPGRTLRRFEGQC